MLRKRQTSTLPPGTLSHKLAERDKVYCYLRSALDIAARVRKLYVNSRTTRFATFEAFLETLRGRNNLNHVVDACSMHAAYEEVCSLSTHRKLHN